MCNFHILAISQSCSLSIKYIYLSRCVTVLSVFYFELRRHCIKEVIFCWNNPFEISSNRRKKKVNQILYVHHQILVQYAVWKGCLTRIFFVLKLFAEQSITPNMKFIQMYAKEIVVLWLLCSFVYVQ